MQVTTRIYVSPAFTGKIGMSCRNAEHNSRGENREAGDESNEREDVMEEMKGQRTRVKRG